MYEYSLMSYKDLRATINPYPKLKISEDQTLGTQVVPFMQTIPSVTFIHRSDHTSELQCMIANWHLMVAYVYLFEVADAPMNWYVYSIPLF